MASSPMDRPVPLACEGRELHWDRIAKLWLCDHCGTSLAYDAWNTGAGLECGAHRLPAATGVRNPQHTYLRRSG